MLDVILEVAERQQCSWQFLERLHFVFGLVALFFFISLTGNDQPKRHGCGSDDIGPLFAESNLPHDPYLHIFGMAIVAPGASFGRFRPVALSSES